MRGLWASVRPGENTGRASCRKGTTAARHQCRTRDFTATVDNIASTSSPCGASSATTRGTDPERRMLGAEGGSGRAAPKEEGRV